MNVKPDRTCGQFAELLGYRGRAAGVRKVSIVFDEAEGLAMVEVWDEDQGVRFPLDVFKLRAAVESP